MEGKILKYLLKSVSITLCMCSLILFLLKLNWTFRVFCSKHDPGNRTNHYGEFLLMASLICICFRGVHTTVSGTFEQTERYSSFLLSGEFLILQEAVGWDPHVHQKSISSVDLGNVDIWSAPDLLHNWLWTQPFMAGRPKQLVKTWHFVCSNVRTFTSASSPFVAVLLKRGLSFWRIPKSFLHVAKGYVKELLPPLQECSWTWWSWCLLRLEVVRSVSELTSSPGMFSMAVWRKLSWETSPLF